MSDSDNWWSQPAEDQQDGYYQSNGDGDGYWVSTPAADPITEPTYTAPIAAVAPIAAPAPVAIPPLTAAAQATAEPYYITTVMTNSGGSEPTYETVLVTPDGNVPVTQDQSGQYVANVAGMANSDVTGAGSAATTGAAIDLAALPELNKTASEKAFGTGFGQAAGYAYSLKNSEGDDYQRYDAQGNLTEYLDQHGQWQKASDVKPVGTTFNPLTGQFDTLYSVNGSEAITGEWVPGMSVYHEDQGGFLGEGAGARLAGLGLAALSAGVAGGAFAPLGIGATGTAAAANPILTAITQGALMSGASTGIQGGSYSDIFKSSLIGGISAGITPAIKGLDLGTVGNIAAKTGVQAGLTAISGGDVGQAVISGLISNALPVALAEALPEDAMNTFNSLPDPVKKVVMSTAGSVLNAGFNGTDISDAATSGVINGVISLGKDFVKGAFNSLTESELAQTVKGYFNPSSTAGDFTGAYENIAQYDPNPALDEVINNLPVTTPPLVQNTVNLNTPVTAETVTTPPLIQTAMNQSNPDDVYDQVVNAFNNPQVGAPLGTLASGSMTDSIVTLPTTTDTGSNLYPLRNFPDFEGTKEDLLKEINESRAERGESPYTSVNDPTFNRYLEILNEDPSVESADGTGTGSIFDDLEDPGGVFTSTGSATNAGTSTGANTGSIFDDLEDSGGVLTGTNTVSGSAPNVDEISKLYREILGRDPDAEGLNYWAQSGQDLNTIAENIRGSQESQASSGTGTDTGTSSAGTGTGNSGLPAGLYTIGQAGQVSPPEGLLSASGEPLPIDASIKDVFNSILASSTDSGSTAYINAFKMPIAEALYNSGLRGGATPEQAQDLVNRFLQDPNNIEALRSDISRMMNIDLKDLLAIVDAGSPLTQVAQGTSNTEQTETDKDKPKDAPKINAPQGGSGTLGAALAGDKGQMGAVSSADSSSDSPSDSASSSSSDSSSSDSASSDSASSDSSSESSDSSLQSDSSSSDSASSIDSFAEEQKSQAVSAEAQDVAVTSAESGEINPVDIPIVVANLTNSSNILDISPAEAVNQGLVNNDGSLSNAGVNLVSSSTGLSASEVISLENAQSTTSSNTSNGGSTSGGGLSTVTDSTSGGSNTSGGGTSTSTDGTTTSSNTSGSGLSTTTVSTTGGSSTSGDGTSTGGSNTSGDGTSTGGSNTSGDGTSTGGSSTSGSSTSGDGSGSSNSSTGGGGTSGSGSGVSGTGGTGGSTGTDAGGQGPGVGPGVGPGTGTGTGTVVTVNPPSGSYGGARLTLNPNYPGALPGSLEGTYLKGVDVDDYNPFANYNTYQQIAPVNAAQGGSPLQLMQLQKGIVGGDPRQYSVIQNRPAPNYFTYGEDTSSNTPTTFAGSQMMGKPKPSIPVTPTGTIGGTDWLYGAAGSNQLSPAGAALPPLASGLMAGGGMAHGGLDEGDHNPEFITGLTGHYVRGRGDGQSDDIPAMLADGEYVFDSSSVSTLGNGSSDAGAKLLDAFRETLREHTRSAPKDKIPPKASPLQYMQEAMKKVGMA